MWLGVRNNPASKFLGKNTFTRHGDKRQVQVCRPRARRVRIPRLQYIPENQQQPSVFGEVALLQDSTHLKNSLTSNPDHRLWSLPNVHTCVPTHRLPGRETKMVLSANGATLHPIREEMADVQSCLSGGNGS